MLVRHSRPSPPSLPSLLLAGACSRDEGETEAGTETTAAVRRHRRPRPPTTSRLDAGGFGDLENVCQDGDATGATDVGVTDDIIQRRHDHRQGLHRPARAQRGDVRRRRRLRGVVQRARRHQRPRARRRRPRRRAHRRTTAGSPSPATRTSPSSAAVPCSTTPTTAAASRAASRTSPATSSAETARGADLQVQPVPNPPGEHLLRRVPTRGRGLARADRPLRRDHVVVRLGARRRATTPSTPPRQLGYTVVYSEEYNPGGESNWRPFVEGMRDADVQVLEFVGEPTFFAPAPRGDGGGRLPTPR